jgi:hypothetical protein
VVVEKVCPRQDVVQAPVVSSSKVLREREIGRDAQMQAPVPDS